MLVCVCYCSEVNLESVCEHYAVNLVMFDDLEWDGIMEWIWIVFVLFCVFV